MMTKKEMLEAALRGEGCLGKAADDEPVFLLRAQDNLSDGAVDWWATRASLLAPVVGGEATGHKIQDARATAEAMRHWPIRKNPD
jgi:hypothetical protein